MFERTKALYAEMKAAQRAEERARRAFGRGGSIAELEAAEAHTKAVIRAYMASA